MGFGNSGDRMSESQPMRPSPNSMMLKPKTPFSLPKSAMARLDGINPVPSSKIDKVMMTSNEPAVIIQKSASNSKKMNEKKNQGPTRDEVFGKIDQILSKLYGDESTNEAFTTWKEIDIPAKMVNNALIHLFKNVLKQTSPDSRALSCQFVDQLFTNELITGVQVRESLARLISSPLSGSDQGITSELAAWSVSTEKVKLAEVAEMTDGGATHPLFFSTLQVLAVKDEAGTFLKFKDSNIKMLDQLPLSLRTEEQLGLQLEEKNLSFLFPLLAIKADMWRQLEGGNTATFLAWVQNTVPPENRNDSGFVSTLVSAVVRYIGENSTLSSDDPNDTPEKDVTDKEKEMISNFKEILQTFLTNREVQFVALYETDIVDEHVFLKWKGEVNDSYPGKGKALFQVNQWLTWFEEAESEDEDEHVFLKWK